jgi:hypothetical protein
VSFWVESDALALKLTFHYFKEYRQCIKCVILLKIWRLMNLRPLHFWNKSARKSPLPIRIKIICRAKTAGTTGNGKSKTEYAHLTS